MSKVIAASMVFVLVVGSGAFGDVVGLVQNEMTQMGVNNSVELLHGSQNAMSLQTLVLQNNQNITGICESHACQSLLAAVTQSGAAQGQCALIGLAQDLAVLGDQQQAVSQGYGPAGEAQGLGMQASQSLARTDGSGAADAVHVIVLNAQQNAQNPATTQNESSNVLGLQQGTVDGQPGSTALVQSSMSVVTTQTQGTV